MKYWLRMSLLVSLVSKWNMLRSLYRCSSRTRSTCDQIQQKGVKCFNNVSETSHFWNIAFVKTSHFWHFMFSTSRFWNISCFELHITETFHISSLMFLKHCFGHLIPFCCARSHILSTGETWKSLCMYKTMKWIFTEECDRLRHKSVKI